MAGNSANISKLPPDQSVNILLKEYEACEQNNTSVGNWIWTSSTIFASAWIAGLALIASKETVDQKALWVLAIASIPAQFIWLVFLLRSFRIMDVLEERQRQIEVQLGMMKNNLLYLKAKHTQENIKAMKYSPNYQRMVHESAAAVKKTIHAGVLERCVMRIWESTFKPWIGGEGRGALYALAVIISLAWLVYAFWTQFGH